MWRVILFLSLSVSACAHSELEIDMDHVMDDNQEIHRNLSETEEKLLNLRQDLDKTRATLKKLAEDYCLYTRRCEATTP